MIDWSNIFNIVAVSATGALVLFLLVSTIVVAAKGKRKCNAFDVILRIIATLVFIAATALVCFSVLSMLDGDFRLAFVSASESDSAAATPVLIFGAKSIELPLGALFLLLSTAIGLMLSALLFICSLAALVVDCLVANKKTEKQPASKSDKKQTKTPEQLKREAELERIRRIGENAVRKTSEAAKSAEAKPTEAKSAQAAQVVADKTVKSAPEQSDWRVEEKSKSADEPTAFVGISDSVDADFDTFDSFDDTPTEDGNVEEEVGFDAEQPVEQEYSADESSFEEQEQTPDFVDGFADADAAGEENAEEYDEVSDEEPELYAAENDAFAEDGSYGAKEVFDAENESNADDEQEQIDADVFAEADGRVEEEEIDVPDDNGEQEFFVAEDDAEEKLDRVEEARDTDGAVHGEQAQPYESGKETVRSRVEDDGKPFWSEPNAERIYPDSRDEDDYDRDIYIPGIRTIVKYSGGPTGSRKPSDAGQKRSAGETRTAKKPSAKKPTAKPAAQTAPVREQSRGDKRNTTKQPAGRASTSQAERDGNKKLPVTRRYVILDRRNAVNMFGEYLKDREQAQKDKLKSSINTIIIE